MNITVLGSCSGTEPMPGRHHVSFAVEHNGGTYWFDAGESCSHNAHVGGIDLLATRAIFISHVHMDHIGGLPNLLRNLRKLESRAGEAAPLKGKTIHVRIPDMRCWQAIHDLLRASMNGYNVDFSLDVRPTQDGVCYEGEGLRVAALHNRHLGDPAPGEPWRSFSYRIEADGKSLVYSGDVRHVSDFDPLLDGGCDLLFMETGHHKPTEVCAWLKEQGKEFGRLVFIHHGRAILADSQGELAAARDILGDCVELAEDGMKLGL